MSDLRGALASALGSEYTVTREIGGGGMSRVFLADEHAMGRRIVVKLVGGDVGESVSLERFRREIQVAAALQHPNIVPVLSAGDVASAADDGLGTRLPYYTMPFIDGESLRTKLAAGPLPVAEVVNIIRDVAKALVHAHEQGLVHRDIKPDNVLIVGGAAVVTDFGIAKALAAAARGQRAEADVALSDGALTALGMAMGTPAYMAPEQATGDPRTDHRADIYALGVTAYEALAGTPPFTGATHREVMVAHVRDKPTPIAQRRGGIPHALAAFIMRCLEKDPARRYQTARELLDALDAAVSLAREPSATAGDVADADVAPAIAVLPFANLSGDPENEYFADGVTEEIMSVLGRLRTVRVAARTSSFAFKGGTTDLATIAETLRVRTVLEGSVRRAGNRVRITAQLTDAATGFQLWSDRYDAELTDIFALQDRIADSVAGALKPRLEARASHRDDIRLPFPSLSTTRSTINVAAYEAYLRGRFYLDRQVEGMGLAFPHFERAIALDPTFAPAYAGMARGFVQLALFVAASVRDALPRAREMANRALALDPASPEAEAVLGAVALLLDWDWRAAAPHYEAAVALDPGAGAPRQYRSLAHSVMGLHDAAIDDANELLRLDPLSMAAHRQVILSTAIAGNAGVALEASGRALRLEPMNAMIVTMSALALIVAGEPEAALERLAPLVASELRSTLPHFFYALALVATNATAELRLLQTQLRARCSHTWISETLLGYINWALGQTTEARDCLRRGVDARDWWLCVLPHLTATRDFREHPMISPLLAKTGPLNNVPD